MGRCEVDYASFGATCAIDEQEVSRICEFVLNAEGVTRPCAVSVSIVSDQQMRETNATWRNTDRVTDVISLECERPDDPDLADGETCELGDILLAPCYIAEQARRFNTTPADETRLLLVHAMLHLLGYDHIVEEEALVMEAREDELLETIKTDYEIGTVTLTRHREMCEQ